MTRYILITLMATLLLAGCGTGRHAEVKEYNRGINIVPKPYKITETPGVFELNDKTALQLKGDGAEKAANYLKRKIKTAAGFELNEGAAGKGIVLTVNADSTMGEEGYSLIVTPETVTIASSAPRGLFYGVQTLLQLLPAEIESSSRVEGVSWTVPCVEIQDKPRFKWRGMHLDVCRHFFPVEFIKKQLDIMAMYKLNTFHWHLTEDQGWRIEIKKYPKLTEIGSKRIDEGREYKGFYTQEQIREIVQYAADRYINVVPEIEMPGHSLAALAAYPEYSCTGGPFKVRNVWGVEPDIYCAGNDATFAFLEDIIKEVVQLFPYKYFHIGGDEAPKARWKECAKCQKRIKDEGLHSEHELQSWFVQRIEKVLLKHGKKMIGWDEILEGGLAPSATVMSWRGEKGGIEAASQGHDVVMTPGNWVYLDHYQGSNKVEPVAIGGYTILEESYGYEPVPEELDKEKQKHILGTQGNVWTEYMYSPELAEYRIYPRIIALAEVNWTVKEKKDFTDFLKRMNNQFVRLDGHGINYHVPLPEGPVNTVAFTDSAVLRFATTRPVAMHYTLDGSEPGPGTERYEKPLVFHETTTVKIRTVPEAGKMSKVRSIRVLRQKPKKAVTVDSTKSGLSLRIAKGEIYSVKEIGKLKDWTDYQVDEMKQANGLFSYKDPSVGIYTGYFVAPEDDVYEFSTNMDEFYIDGDLLISNDGEVKRFSRNDASVVLKKGLHPVKLVFINNVVGGWPSAWNGFNIRYKTKNENKVIKLGPGDFVH